MRLEDDQFGVMRNDGRACIYSLRRALYGSQFGRGLSIPVRAALLFKGLRPQLLEMLCVNTSRLERCNTLKITCWYKRQLVFASAKVCAIQKSKVQHCIEVLI